jgi:exodeoxyribonuclease VII, large subunit
MSQELKLSVSDFIALTNQTLDYAYNRVFIEGEVSSFKINQGKYIFFDLKDENSTINCFMMVFQLRTPIEDGMKVSVCATPKLTDWGRFSLTVSSIRLSGEGDIKKSSDLLKRKLQKEGLFSLERKRPLPAAINKIAVISSPQAAGYADFIKILGERWSGLVVDVASVQVQGVGSSDQIIRAIRYLNQKAEYDVIAIIRGGGSAEDLSTFNDELLVREIATSKIPIITGIGHETDESLADLVSDVAASTPSNVAQMLTRDKRAEIVNIKASIVNITSMIIDDILHEQHDVTDDMTGLRRQISITLSSRESIVQEYMRAVRQLDPENALKRGYSVLSGNISVGSVVNITTNKNIIQAEVKDVKKR